jgi:predicted HicB family RNase H-like nuclease
MSDKILEHRGFKGTTEVSLEDNVIFGKLLDIDALIMYSADNVADLRTAFVQAVDEYLADCEREGIEPQRPYSGTFNVRVGSDLHRKAASAARKRDMKLNEFVKIAISKEVEYSDPEVARMSALWTNVVSKMSKIDSWNERAIPQSDYLPESTTPVVGPIRGEGLLATFH